MSADIKIHHCNYGGPHGEGFVSIPCVEKAEYDKLASAYESEKMMAEEHLAAFARTLNERDQARAASKFFENKSTERFKDLLVERAKSQKLLEHNSELKARVIQVNGWLHDAVEEIKCLRSVLSEWEQDKSCYLQMNRADELARQRATPVEAKEPDPKQSAEYQRGWHACATAFHTKAGGDE